VPTDDRHRFSVEAAVSAAIRPIRRRHAWFHRRLRSAGTGSLQRKNKCWLERYELKTSLQTDRSVYYGYLMKNWSYPVVRLGALSFCLVQAAVGLTPAEQRQPANQIMNDTNPLSSFQVIEFRRYTIKEGERENFIRYFETY